MAGSACGGDTESSSAPSPALIVQGPTPSASRPPSPSADADVVRGWPDTTENLPGVYSWDGSGGRYSVEGFMHNGYGFGDVEIRIEVVTGNAPCGDDSGQLDTSTEGQGIFQSG